ncbi:MAG: hypothetical protein J7M19_02115 [Planctomycetes bacterium]|nr:hypothetical protein [Planctomycetota bacterium]
MCRKGPCPRRALRSSERRVHLDPRTLCCTIYGHRPQACRNFDCRGRGLFDFCAADE